MQALCANSVAPLVKQALIGHLTRSFTSTFHYRKSRNLADAISRLAQGIEHFTQPEAQRADHACSYHRDACSGPFPIRAGGFGHLSRRKKMIPDSYCFLKRSILLVRRNGK